MSTPKPKLCPVCGNPFDGPGYVIGIASTGGAAPLYPNVQACSAHCKEIANAKRPHREVHLGDAAECNICAPTFASPSICSMPELTVEAD